MEVHAHTQTERKKWTHYLWEFLMLFLAVFCGFLAENFREHQVEKARERQYMQSMIQDLQSDTSSLNIGFPLKDQRINAIDSIFLFFEKNPLDEKTIPYNIYRLMQRSTWDRINQRNSGTIDQLKNAGGMRLIRNKIVADSIAKYDCAWQIAEYWREGYETHQQKLNDLTDRIYNAGDLVSTYRNPVGSALMSANTDSMKIKINTGALNEYINVLSHVKVNTFFDRLVYQRLEKRAERLIEFIKKEYHLQ